MGIDFINELNKNQYLAATSNAKYLRIIAGAGTGKTRTLTYRLAYLIGREGMVPSEIVAITFTNKVAKEMKERVTKILNDNNFDVLGFPLILTFHGFCYRFLLREITQIRGYRLNFQIADDTDQNAIFKKIADKLHYKATSREFKDYISIIHSLKTSGVECADFSSSDVGPSIDFRRVQDVYEEYQKELIRCNLVDFDDLLLYTRKIMQNNEKTRAYYQSKIRCFLVDEFQDTNDIQYDIVRLFMNKECELCVVGDPDQTIYTWRGADNSIIKDKLRMDFSPLETITLDLNYRSTQKILDKANMLIKNNKNRVDKSLTAYDTSMGDEVEYLREYSSAEEAKAVARKIQTLHNDKNVDYSDIAIIYRSNYLSREFEHAFPMIGIPYRLYGSIKFYDRLEVKTALSYLRLIVNRDDNLSLERALKYPSRKIGDITLEKLYLEANKYGLPLLDYLLTHLDEAPLGASSKDSVSIFLKAYVVAAKILNSDKVVPVRDIDLVIRKYLDESGFNRYVRELDIKEKDSVDKYQSREDNINELYKAIQTYLLSGEGESLTLTDFLINVSMEAAQDTMQETNAVTVMTAHISKGLEYKYVFVTGLVDCVFPSRHAIDTGRQEAIEEERRLFYVAMTRAKKYLCISSFGGSSYDGSFNIPSRFIKEIGFVSKPTRNSLESSFSHRGLENARQGNARFTSGEGGWKNTNSELFAKVDKAYASGGYSGDENYDNDYTFKPLPKKMGISKPNFEKSSDSYAIGDKVAHVSYGVGKVIAVDGNKIKVSFGEEFGIKTLVIGFKAFKKID